MDDELKNYIHRALQNATMKIFVGGNFKGTGFFITPDGYVLTAFHCIGLYPPEIIVETCIDGQYQAILEEDKSLKDINKYDIAVLKVNDYQPSHYVPIGTVSKQHITDKVVSMGYPAGHRPQSQDIGIYFGNISRFHANNRIECNVIKGQGQSGGLLYHYKTQRVVGLAVEGFKSINTGMATRFGPLFEKWPALEAINNEVARKWDERLISFTRQKNKSVPDGSDCLWYLPDRAEQKDRLCEAIQVHEKNTTHQPLLCLIHGDEQEAHDKFKECVVDKELPRLNKLYRSDSNKGIWEIEPFSVNFNNISELQNEVLKMLVERVLHDYPDDQEHAIAKIAKRLGEDGRPVTLWIKIFTKYCQYQKGLIEQGILDFWAKWPKTNKRNYRLLLFLSFHYPDKNQMGLNLKKLFNSMFKFFPKARTSMRLYLSLPPSLISGGKDKAKSA